MKFAFFGTPEFAAAILAKLIEADMPPAAVICNPDRPVGRKHIITPPPTKILAEKNAVRVFQPGTIDDLERDIEAPEFDGCDIAIVAAYAKIIPQKAIDRFPRGMIGVHPSLLPKYRGASPIQSAILGGETITGVTLYLLDDKVDHGSILARQELEIQNMGYGMLADRLAKLGGALLVKTMPAFLGGTITPQPQYHDEATFTKKFSTNDAFIPEAELTHALNSDDREGAAKIERMIRALNPEPGAWTRRDGKRLKLLEAELREGKLVLKKTQLEGEKPKNAT